jgi:hypothetical protein
MSFEYKPTIELLTNTLNNFIINKEEPVNFCVCYRIHTNITEIIDHLINTLIAYDNINIIIISLPKILYDKLSDKLKNILYFIYFIWFDSYVLTKNKNGITNKKVNLQKILNNIIEISLKFKYKYFVLNTCSDYYVRKIDNDFEIPILKKNQNINTELITKQINILDIKWSWRKDLKKIKKIIVIFMIIYCYLLVDRRIV